MTTLIITGSKAEAAALRGQADAVVRHLEADGQDTSGQLDPRALRGRKFDALHWTADASAVATDDHRAAVLPCIAGESSGRP